VAVFSSVFGASASGELIPVWNDPDLSDCAFLSETTEKLNILTKLPITNGKFKIVGWRQDHHPFCVHFDGF
jgi:hypothetical protein